MKAIWKRGSWITAGAVALALSAHVTEAKADGDSDSVWNAEVTPWGWCTPCWQYHVGFPLLCPCRIADPIIIN